MTRRGTWLVTLAAVALATGCSTLPTSGEVHTQPDQAAAGTDQVPYFVPPGPVQGADREAIVRGFLLATQANPPSTAVARSYLTERMRSTWKPVGATVYDNATLDTTRGGVVAHLSSAHRLDQRGAWMGAASTGSTDVGYDLVLEDGEWRIQNPPAALPVPTSYFSNLYVPFLLYFFDRTGSVLVPSRVYMPAGEQVASSLVRGLLAGPTEANAAATTTALGRGIDLDLSVVVSDEGVAEIPLSAKVETLSPADLYRAVLQLAATLRQLPGLVKIRVTVDGIAVPLVNGQTEVAVDSAPEFDPVAASGRDFVAISGGHVVRNDGERATAVGGPFGEVGFALRSVAESAQRQLLAAVAQNGTRAYVAPAVGSNKAARVRTVLNGATNLLRPTYDRFGGLWLVDARKTGAVVHVISNGHDRVVDAGGISGKQVESFTITRDGTALAAGLSGGTTPTVMVEPLVRAENGQLLSAQDARRVQVEGADLEPIVDIGQDSATTIAVLTQPATGRGRIYSVELDGSPGAAETDFSDPVPGLVAGLVVGPDGRLPLRVVMTDHTLLTLRTSGDWVQTASDILAASYQQ